MTTFRFRLGIVLLVGAALFGALGWWLHPWYIQRKRLSGEREADEIAQACRIPKWALDFDHDGRRQSSGQAPNRPEDVGIYLQSNYAVCPTPDEKQAIACARDLAQRRGYRFTQELRYGEACE